MFHKVRGISVLHDYVLCIEFSEGVTKTYDVSDLFGEIPAFHQLEINPGAFAAVRVDVGGYGIVWNDDLDLSCDELWERGNTCETEFDGLMALSDATDIWGLSESTLRKAIAYGKLVRGIDVSKYGKQWVVATKAMLREYGEPRLK